MAGILSFSNVSYINISIFCFYVLVNNYFFIFLLLYFCHFSFLPSLLFFFKLFICIVRLISDSLCDPKCPWNCWSTFLSLKTGDNIGMHIIGFPSHWLCISLVSANMLSRLLHASHVQEHQIHPVSQQAVKAGWNNKHLFSIYMIDTQTINFHEIFILINLKRLFY